MSFSVWQVSVQALGRWVTEGRVADWRVCRMNEWRGGGWPGERLRGQGQGAMEEGPEGTLAVLSLRDSDHPCLGLPAPLQCLRKLSGVCP